MEAARSLDNYVLEGKQSPIEIFSNKYTVLDHLRIPTWSLDTRCQFMRQGWSKVLDLVITNGDRRQGEMTIDILDVAAIDLNILEKERDPLIDTMIGLRLTVTVTTVKSILEEMTISEKGSHAAGAIDTIEIFWNIL